MFHCFTMHVSVVRRLFAAIPSFRTLQFSLHDDINEEEGDAEAAGEGEVQAAEQELVVVEEMKLFGSIRSGSFF